ncbi:hypothetical protein OYC64_003709, partial [Pagothenia borchgrevinki]
KHRSHKHS